MRSLVCIDGLRVTLPERLPFNLERMLCKSGDGMIRKEASELRVGETSRVSVVSTGPIVSSSVKDSLS